MPDPRDSGGHGRPIAGADRPSPSGPILGERRPASAVGPSTRQTEVPPVPAQIAPIHLSRRVRTGRPATWAALTEPALVAHWFAIVTPLGKVGDPYRVDFEDGSAVDGFVLAVEPGRRFMHSWRWAGDEETRTTRVTWAVEPMSTGGSRIVLEHDGWADAGLTESDRDDHAGYWDAYLEGLRELLDPGRPEPPDEVAG